MLYGSRFRIIVVIDLLSLCISHRIVLSRSNSDNPKGLWPTVCSDFLIDPHYRQTTKRWGCHGDQDSGLGIEGNRVKQHVLITQKSRYPDAGDSSRKWHVSLLKTRVNALCFFSSNVRDAGSYFKSQKCSLPIFRQSRTISLQMTR